MKLKDYAQGVALSGIAAIGITVVLFIVGFLIQPTASDTSARMLFIAIPASVIAVLVSIFIGIPTAYILTKIKKYNAIIAIAIGGLVGLALRQWYGTGNGSAFSLSITDLVLTIYGSVCAYAFYWGTMLPSKEKGSL